MNAAAAPIHLAGSTLGRYRHVCALFSSPQERYPTLLPFVRDGIERGERAIHVVPRQYREEHLHQLRSAGIDVNAVERSHQLEVASPEDLYLQDGGFNKEAMLLTIQEALKAGPTLGFPLTRLIAQGDTSPKDWSKADEWVEYEARLNDIVARFNDVVICTYDTNLLDGTLLVDLLRIHPVFIIGGRLYENPFFSPPAEFLRQLAERSGRSFEPYRRP